MDSAITFAYSSLMGGERASTTRRREAGKICCVCGRELDAAPWPGERRCGSCETNQPRHRVLMNFMERPEGWLVSFLEADCRTSLPRCLKFSHPEKIIDAARKGGADLTSAGRCDLESGIQKGRGGVWLNLTNEQYRKLR